jgi:hypothetical protein
MNKSGSQNYREQDGKGNSFLVNTPLSLNKSVIHRLFSSYFVHGKVSRTNLPCKIIPVSFSFSIHENK